MTSGADHHDDQPETFGSPTEYADAAEAPPWAQGIAKAIACLPAALSLASIAIVVLIVLVVCLVVAAILIF